MDSIPVIDVSGLRASGPEPRQAVAAALGRACREVGFCYVTGHGISDALRQDVFDAARRLFALSAPEKERVSVKLSPHNRGHVGFGTERLDEAAAVDQKEVFNVGLDLPPDNPEVLAGALFRGPNLWPPVPRACGTRCWPTTRRASGCRTAPIAASRST